ncbi:TetR/AcrR family transcriptional regulator [Nocardioides sp.]|uniref:TetR/AcrR family transcriptional regulator n=1 Tax=Nocardioides sp. TaxID=35761 RepID=UPI003D12FE55
MPGEVNTRRYDASRRRESAEGTRRAVLAAAHDLFTTAGYPATSVASIARRAGVSVDTVYASVGRKPQLLLAVHDMMLAGGSEPVPAEQRRYVQEIRQAPTAREKIRLYAVALGTVLPSTVPLLLALRAAGATDPDCLDVSASVAERRAANMRLFAADLRDTGDLRDDISDDWVADLVWSMNSPDYFELLRSRGLTTQQYVDLVTEVWTSTFLRAGVP